jgi:hypothetical protein
LASVQYYLYQPIHQAPGTGRASAQPPSQRWRIAPRPARRMPDGAGRSSGTTSGSGTPPVCCWSRSGAAR